MNAFNKKTYTNREEGIEPLTPRERRWVQKLERVLQECPERLELVTIGDRDLTVITNERGTEDIHDGGVYTRGIVLATISSKCPIHGVTG